MLLAPYNLDKSVYHHVKKSVSMDFHVIIYMEAMEIILNHGILREGHY